MSLIKHCIIDTNTNVVVNIIDYETEQTGIPSGLEEHLFCVKSDIGQIGGTYANGVITNPPQPQPILLGTV
jgi:glucosamine 6-phosphate synthetase-like amidotransferase/phosphosugar isomerase protein